MRDRHRGRQRQMMPLERVGAFTLACVAVLLVVAIGRARPGTVLRAVV
jgi:hypothetical protein